MENNPQLKESSGGSKTQENTAKTSKSLGEILRSGLYEIFQSIVLDEQLEKIQLEIAINNLNELSEFIKNNPGELYLGFSESMIDQRVIVNEFYITKGEKSIIDWTVVDEKKVENKILGCDCAHRCDCKGVDMYVDQFTNFDVYIIEYFLKARKEAQEKNYDELTLGGLIEHILKYISLTPKYKNILES